MMVIGPRHPGRQLSLLPPFFIWLPPGQAGLFNRWRYDQALD